MFVLSQKCPTESVCDSRGCDRREIFGEMAKILKPSLINKTVMQKICFIMQK